MTSWLLMQVGIMEMTAMNTVLIIQRMAAGAVREVDG